MRAVLLVSLCALVVAAALRLARDAGGPAERRRPEFLRVVSCGPGLRPTHDMRRGPAASVWVGDRRVVPFADAAASGAGLLAAALGAGGEPLDRAWIPAADLGAQLEDFLGRQPDGARVALAAAGVQSGPLPLPDGLAPALGDAVSPSWAALLELGGGLPVVLGLSASHVRGVQLVTPLAGGATGAPEPASPLRSIRLWCRAGGGAADVHGPRTRAAGLDRGGAAVDALVMPAPTGGAGSTLRFEGLVVPREGARFECSLAPSLGSPVDGAGIRFEVRVDGRPVGTSIVPCADVMPDRRWTRFGVALPSVEPRRAFDLELVARALGGSPGQLAVGAPLVRFALAPD